MDTSLLRGFVRHALFSIIDGRRTIGGSDSELDDRRTHATRINVDSSYQYLINGAN